VKRFSRRVEDALHQWTHPRGREAVIDPSSRAPSGHQPGAPQICEVARYLWLRKTECLMDMADADFAAVEQVCNAQPCRIAKCLEGHLETDQFVTRS